MKIYQNAAALIPAVREKEFAVNVLNITYRAMNYRLVVFQNKRKSLMIVHLKNLLPIKNKC